MRESESETSRRLMNQKTSEFLELVAFADLEMTIRMRKINGEKVPGIEGRLEILRHHIEKLKEQGL